MHALEAVPLLLLQLMPLAQSMLCALSAPLTAGVWMQQGSRQEGWCQQVHGTLCSASAAETLGKAWKGSTRPQLAQRHACFACCAAANLPAVMPALRSLAVSPLRFGK